MTKRAKEALEILKANPNLSPREFAESFWPDHIMHSACSNQGHGACRGKKAWLQAGSYLAKLIKLKLVQSDYVGERSGTRIRYKLTRAGLEALVAQ